jgi:hypothetical protein
MESINGETFASCYFGIARPSIRTCMLAQRRVPLTLDPKNSMELGIIGLVVIPTNVGMAHKIIFVWDYMPSHMTSLPWNYDSVLNLYKAVVVARSVVQEHLGLFKLVDGAYHALRGNNTAHACRELLVAKDAAIANDAPKFVCCLLTFVSFYGLRIVGLRAVLFDNLCSVASAELMREMHAVL